MRSLQVAAAATIELSEELQIKATDRAATYSRGESS